MSLAAGVGDINALRRLNTATTAANSTPAVVTPTPMPTYTPKSPLDADGEEPELPGFPAIAAWETDVVGVTESDGDVDEVSDVDGDGVVEGVTESEAEVEEVTEVDGDVVGVMEGVMEVEGVSDKEGVGDGVEEAVVVAVAVCVAVAVAVSETDAVSLTVGVGDGVADGGSNRRGCEPMYAMLPEPAMPVFMFEPQHRTSGV